MKEENIIKENADYRAGICLFKKSDALLFLRNNAGKNVNILGIDGFILNNIAIQPSLENSVDFSTKNISMKDSFVCAEEFLKDKDENMYFQIVYRQVI